MNDGALETIDVGDERTRRAAGASREYEKATAAVHLGRGAAGGCVPEEAPTDGQKAGRGRRGPEMHHALREMQHGRSDGPGFQKARSHTQTIRARPDPAQNHRRRAGADGKRYACDGVLRLGCA